MIKINIIDFIKVTYVYFLFILASYNNSIMGVKFGAVGQNLTFFVASIFLLIEIYLFFKYKKFKYSYLDKISLIFIIYSIFISLIFMLYFMLSKGTDGFRGTPYSIKFISYVATLVMLYATYRHWKYLFMNISEKLIYTAIMLALITEFIILLIEIYTIPYAFSSLHFIVPTPYSRIRLLASEASISGVYIIILLSIGFYYSKFIGKSKLSIYFCLAFFITYVMVSSSKGLFVSLFLSSLLFLIVIFFLYKDKNRNIYLLFTSMLVVPIALIIAIPKITEKLNSSGEAVTFSTRFLDFIVSIVGLYKYPFGTGLGVHQEVIYESLFENVNKLSFILGSNIDVSELDSFSYSFFGLDNKNQFNFVISTCGIVGLYLMYKFIFYILKNRLISFVQLYFFLFIMISFTFFISATGNYLLAIYVSFLEINCLSRGTFHERNFA